MLNPSLNEPVKHPYFAIKLLSSILEELFSDRTSLSLSLRLAASL
jgi:hypothetical protein